MARYDEAGRDTTAIYQAAEIFRARCLMAAGSLIFDDSPVWTVADLERLNEKFVDAPDVSHRSFEENSRIRSRARASRSPAWGGGSARHVLPVPVERLR